MFVWLVFVVWWCWCVVSEVFVRDIFCFKCGLVCLVWLSDVGYDMF